MSKKHLERGLLLAAAFALAGTAQALAPTQGCNGGPTPPPPGPPPGGSAPPPGYYTPGGQSNQPGAPLTPGAGPRSPRGPAAPSTPGQGPRSTQLAGPPVPPPGHPFSPFTPDSRGAADALAWQIWWDMNRERYLDLRARIPGARVTTDGDGFHLGAGQLDVHERELRPDPETIERAVLPALHAALRERADVDQRCAELLALARACDPADFGSEYPPDEVLLELLSSPVAEVRAAAALAIGVFGREDVTPTLTAIAMGATDAEEYVGRPQLETSTRAFATYGLSLLAARSDDDELRRGVIWYLTALLARVGEARPDVMVASAIGVGLVPLEVGPPCECGGAQHGPYDSRQAQVHFLLRRFQSEDLPDVARAHLATALARLVADEALPDLSGTVADALIETLVDGDAPRVVREGCAIALGRIGDADLDERDTTIRNELGRMARSGDGLARRFALIALAETGARPGEGEEPFGGTADVRSFLMRELGRGKAGIAEWSALALGVLGHELAAVGQTPGADADAALRNALSRARMPGRQAALALAMGLRADAEASPALVELLEEAQDEEARAFASLALGLVGVQDARGVLGLALESAQTPATRESAAIGLALLGDRAIVERLVALTRSAEDDAQRESAVQALGAVGDRQATERLAEILLDESASALIRTRAAHALGRVCDLDALPWHARLSADLHYAANTETLANPDGTGVLNRR